MALFKNKKEEVKVENVNNTNVQPSNPAANQATAVQQPNVVSPSPAAPKSPTTPTSAPAKTPQDANKAKAPEPKTAEQIVAANIDERISKTDEIKENPRLKSFSYVIINTMGKKEKGSFDAETIDEVKNFLTSQGYQVLEVKPRSAMDIDIGSNKLKAESLSFTLTQLSTYIKSGIPLADAVRILAKQAHKPSEKKIWSQVVYELLKGESFSIALAKQGKTFPPLLINMVKTSEMTGDLPSILDDMAEYYTSMNQTRKQMKSAMTYPIVILTIAFAVLIFMLVYLVPQFSSMFEEQNATLPGITLAILGVSDFIQSYWYILLSGLLVLIFGFRFAFKKIASFRKGVQATLMHLPVVKDIIIYNEIANFTKTFASLINHGVFITDSMEILSKITNNEIYKEIISNTLENLAKGDTVSSAFRGQWAVPIVAYEMIVTGENTGQLGLMMEKVSTHFQSMHRSIIDQMKSLMEPFMIICLAGIVGVILLSIVTPMFSIYSQIEMIIISLF